jgi:hypothetical protein
MLSSLTRLTRLANVSVTLQFPAFDSRSLITFQFQRLVHHTAHRSNRLMASSSAGIVLSPPMGSPT